MRKGVRVGSGDFLQMNVLVLLFDVPRTRPLSSLLLDSPALFHLQFDDVMNVNLKGSWLTARQFAMPERVAAFKEKKLGAR